MVVSLLSASAQIVVDLTNEFEKLVKGPNGLVEQVKAIESLLSEVEVRRFVPNPATKTYVEIGSSPASLLRIYAGLGRGKFIVSKVGNHGMALQLRTVEEGLRASQARKESQLLEALRMACQKQSDQYEHWQATFEKLATDPSRVSLEIEWETNLLRVRDFIEYAAIGLEAVRMDGRLLSLLVPDADAERRLGSLITEYLPRLLKAYHDYHVPDQEYFPERFWWREKAWALRNQLDRSGSISD